MNVATLWGFVDLSMKPGMKSLLIYKKKALRCASKMESPTKQFRYFLLLSVRSKSNAKAALP